MATNANTADLSHLLVEPGRFLRGGICGGDGLEAVFLRMKRGGEEIRNNTEEEEW